MGRHSNRFSIVALSSILWGASLIAGCGYGEVSPLAYDYSMSLYAICNRRDDKKLGELRGMIEASLEQREISDRESRWLCDIIAAAESGQWQQAAKQARRLMEDQVKRP